MTLLAPSTLLLAVLFFYPLLGIFLRSFDPHGGLSYLHPSFDVTNYSQLVEDVGFHVIFINTFKIAFVATIVCVVLGYPVAYLLSELPRSLANGLLVLILVPFWTSILVRLYAWTVILSPQGIANAALVSLRYHRLDLLFNTAAVIVGMIHYLLPYMILVLYSTMVGIDRRLLDAAYSLGASSFYAFVRVFFPLSLRGLYAGALLVFIIGLGFFVTPAVLGGPSDITLAIYIQEWAQRLNWGVSSAMGIVLLVITVALFIIFNRLFSIERLARGIQH